MRRRGRLVPAALACLVVGAGLLLAVDQPLARAAAVLALFAFIVLGSFAVATPEYLREEDDDERPGPPPG